MKKILASVAALAALSAAAPAFAAPGDYGREAPRYSGYGDDQFNRQFGRYPGADYRGTDLRGDLVRLEGMINAGVRNGSIDRRESRMLYAQLRDIRVMHIRFIRANGRLDPRERMILDRRVNALRADIWRESRDRDYRGGYGGYGGRW
jgi:hypothetical protein